MSYYKECVILTFVNFSMTELLEKSTRQHSLHKLVPGRMYALQVHEIST